MALRSVQNAKLPEAFEIPITKNDVSTPVRDRLEQQQENAENVDPSMLAMRLEEAASRRKAVLEERQAKANAHSQLALEKQYIVESRELQKKIEMQQVLEEKQKHAEEKKAILDTRKQAKAWQLAGGEVQGKDAREAMVNALNCKERSEVALKLAEKAHRAAMNKAALEDAKVASAKKTSRKDLVDLSTAAKQKAAQDHLEQKQLKAAILAESEKKLKITKARQDLAKGDHVRTAKKLLDKQKAASPEDKFFTAPHDDFYASDTDENPFVSPPKESPPTTTECNVYPRDAIIIQVNDDVPLDDDPQPLRPPSSSSSSPEEEEAALLLHEVPPPFTHEALDTTSRTKESCQCGFASLFTSFFGFL